MIVLKRVLPMLVLIAVFSAITVQYVRGQATSITSLRAPSTALVGQDTIVTVAATFNLGSQGYAVSIGILDLDDWWTKGTAASSEQTCSQLTGQMAEEAFCAYIPTSRYGSDMVTFHLKFNSAKTYRLRAGVELFYSNAQLIPNVNTFQDFFIVVSAAPTSTKSQAYPTLVASTTSVLQMPQPPQSATSQGANNMQQIVLVIAVMAAVALGSLILYSRRGKLPRITRAKKAQPAKSFCIECGNELPPKSKFCNKCGTEQ